MLHRGKVLFSPPPPPTPSLRRSQGIPITELMANVIHTPPLSGPDSNWVFTPRAFNDCRDPSYVFPLDCLCKWLKFEYVHTQRWNCDIYKHFFMNRLRCIVLILRHWNHKKYQKQKTNIDFIMEDFYGLFSCCIFLHIINHIKSLSLLMI